MNKKRREIFKALLLEAIAAAEAAKEATQICSKAEEILASGIDAEKMLRERAAVRNMIEAGINDSTLKITYAALTLAFEVKIKEETKGRGEK